MKRQIAVVMLVAMSAMVFLLPGKFVLAQMDDPTDVSTDEGITAIPNTESNYDQMQANLQQDRLSDALRRIQMLEQSNRFLSRRVELLERDVNDIKNDRY